MARAEQMSEQENWTEAGKAYRYALAEFPNNEAAIVGFGRSSLHAGQSDFALRAFQQVLKVNPMNDEAMGYMGQIQEQSGQTEAAAETYLRLGNIYAGKYNFESAVEVWARSVELVPHQVEAHRKLANALNQNGQPRLAARQLLSLAAVYQQRGNIEAAMKVIQQIDELVPDDPGLETAREALQSGSPIQADMISETPPAKQEADPFADYGDDLFEDPFAMEDELGADDAPKKGLVGAAQEKALTNLANVVFEDNSEPQNTMLIIQAIDLQANDKLSEAANNYHKVVQAGMQNPSLYFNLGLLWKELGQFNQAVEMLNAAAQDSQYNLSAQFTLGEIFYENGKLDSALKQFVEVIKTVDLRLVQGHKTQTLQQRYDNVVNDYLGQGDTDKINTFIRTIETFFAHPAWERKALEARQLMDATEEEGMMTLADYLETPQTEVVISAMALTSRYLKRNLLMTASEECLRAIQNAPAYLPLHVRLADILFKQGRTEEAVSKYLYIAKIHEMRGTPEQSVEVYKKVLDIAPMDIRVRSELIDVYKERGDIEQALQNYLILADSHYQLAQIDKAVKKYNEALHLTRTIENGNRWRIDILGRMGDILNQRFDWAGATRVYEELNKLKPNDDKIQRRLIDLYYRQNKIREAIIMLDKLLALYQRQSPLKTVEVLKDLSSGNPDDMNLRQRLAIAYAQNGMTKEAIAEYDTLGDMQLENGMRTEAAQTIQAILNLGPEDPEGYRRLLDQLGSGEFG